MQVCDCVCMCVCVCVCGLAGDLITRRGTPSCLHPQINNAGDGEARSKHPEGEREGDDGFKTSSNTFIQTSHDTDRKGFERRSEVWDDNAVNALKLSGGEGATEG